MSEKTMTATVTISSNPATAHIGRYFIDLRDTTNGANRQMATKITDDPAEYLAQVTTEGIRQGVWVETIDETGEAWEPSLTQ